MGLPTPPSGTQVCPSTGGTVTGTITAADIQDLSTTQGLSAGDLSDFLKALKSGDTYVNVHTVNFPMGEIRGQIYGPEF
jgi:hypothetical protein